MYLQRLHFVCYLKSKSPKLSTKEWLVLCWNICQCQCATQCFLGRSKEMHTPGQKMINNITGRQKINNGSAGGWKKSTRHGERHFLLPARLTRPVSQWRTGSEVGRAARHTKRVHRHSISPNCIRDRFIVCVCAPKGVATPEIKHNPTADRLSWESFSVWRSFLFFAHRRAVGCERVDYYFMQGVAYSIKNSLFVRARSLSHSSARLILYTEKKSEIIRANSNVERKWSN